MASPTLSPLPGAHAAELIPIPFRATFDAANDPTLVEGKRAVASVTRTAAGKFKVTLREGFVALMAAGLTLKAAAAVDLVPQVLADDVTTAAGGTVEFRLLAAAVETDPPAAGANATSIMGCLWVRNISVS